MELGKSHRGKGRPRSFDLDRAIEVAQSLFHDRGYEGIGIAELTDAMGIAAPSFYSAFGSKAGLFAKVLKRYESTGPVPMLDMLVPGRPPAETLFELLLTAANSYASDPRRRGCLAFGGLRCGNADARAAAESTRLLARDALRTFLKESMGGADDLADLVLVTLTGLSIYARQGADRAALVAVVHAVRPAIMARVHPCS